MKHLKLIILVVGLLYLTACDQPDGLGGYNPIETENGNETEIKTKPKDEINDDNDDNETVIDNGNYAENENNGEDEIDEDDGNDEDESDAIGLADFSGDGTPENPYLIVTVDDLCGLAIKVNTGTTYASSCYRLTADINLQGVKWIPIGTNTNRFSGTFDGNGKIISGLHITESQTDQGLFGVIGKNGKVCNLGVSGIVLGGENSGGIAGSNYATIENCYSAVTVTGNEYAGGIAGRNRTDGKIENCYSTGSIASGNYAGGITGYNSGAVRRSVSLCLTVNGLSAGRISGHTTGSYTNNKARSDMIVNSFTVPESDTKANNKEGLSIALDGTLTQASVFGDWDTTIWHITDDVLTLNGELPVFKNIDIH